MKGDIMKKLLAVITSTVLFSGMLSAGAAAAQADTPEAVSVYSSSAAASSSVKIKSLKLAKSKVTLAVGESYTVKVSVTPSNASNKKLKYSSSDKSVAKVSSEGKVTAVKEGKAVISVKTADGSKKTAKLTVTVTAAEKKPAEKTKSSNGFDTKITAKQLVKDMRVGYNFGNNLDAYNGNEFSDKGVGTETSWGNPKITKKMVNAVKAEGFNTIRFPVTWHDHLDADYNINKDWLKRVKEVVDYAADNDMYIIVNMHHDNSVYNMGEASKSDEKYKETEERYLKIWSQIADQFKDYDEHLIFESMNEPRTEGSAKEWTGGTAPEHDVVNKLNAAFVKLIRNSGGNNKYRFLMLPGYAASSSDIALNAVKLPDDDRIIFSVHAYSPYNFAFNGKGSKTFTDSDKRELDRFFSTLNDKFVKKGYPVVIGEMGAINKENLSERVKWAEYYVKNARKYNITCIWWDNGGFNVGDENFGIFDRLKCSFRFKDIADALVEYSE